MVKRILLAPVIAVVDVTAAVFRHRAAIIELVGATCLAVAAGLVAIPLGLAVAGAALVAKAAEIDKKSSRS